MSPGVEPPNDQQNERVARAIDALRADYDRQGYVTEDQVVRAVHKRKIEAEGHLRIRQALSDAGIEVEDSSTETQIEALEELADANHDDAVRRYLVEIGKFRLLRPDEEISLGRRVQTGRQALESLSRPDLTDRQRTELLRLHRSGLEAEHQMISANLRLVVSIAKRYSRTLSMDLLDLIQEGTLGLMHAVERFDCERGYKFSTYATWWILQSVTRSIADKDRLIRLPVHVIEALAKLRKLRRRLAASLQGREPDPGEMAVHLGWTVEKVRLLLSVAEDTVSIDVPVGDSDESSLGDLLRSASLPDPEQTFAYYEEKEHIDAVVDQLGDRIAEVIRLRFGIETPEERTLQEIGEMKGVTRERIRQIESKGLGLLRRKRELRRIWEPTRVRVRSRGADAQIAGEVLLPKPKVRTEAVVTGGGVLVSIFDRLSMPVREVLVVRYGLDGLQGLSEEEAAERLEMRTDRLRHLELKGLRALCHTEDSFRRLLATRTAVRNGLLNASLAARKRSASLDGLAVVGGDKT